MNARLQPPADSGPAPTITPGPAPQPLDGQRWRIATVSLGGCFGCHMSLLDIDERLFELLPLIQLDRSPLTDIKTVGAQGLCDIGLIEGGLCNAENVEVLREFRAHCRVLVAVGACAINGGLPAQRNHLDVGQVLQQVYLRREGLAADARIPADPELPLPLDRVLPLDAVVRVDHHLPGCPPSADAIWDLLTALIAGRPPGHVPLKTHYD